MSTLAQWHATNYADPVGYANEVLGIQLWSAQQEIAEALRDNDRVTVRSSNAVGKSYLAACMVPWYLQSRPGPKGYVVTTAASWQGLTKILWPEIKSVIRGARLRDLRDLGDPKYLLTLEWKIADKYAAFSVSPKDEEGFGGYHNPGGTLFIVDEASALGYAGMDAIEGVCSGEGSKILLIGNPLRPSGPFYDSFKKDNWEQIHISAFDSPNIICGRNVIPGLASQSWIDSRREDWGEGSPAWQARVLGEFPSEGEHTLIPLSWAEAAVRRGEEYGVDTSLPVVLGVDVAREGEDKTVIQPVQGDFALQPEKYGGRTYMDIVADLVEAAIEKYHPIRVNIDDIGVGGGALDILTRKGYGSIVHGVNVGVTENVDTTRFVNLRAQLWWNLREWIHDVGIIPNDKGLIGAICAPEYGFKAGTGKIIIEDKKLTKKRLKRSPDEADALMLALAHVTPTLASW